MSARFQIIERCDRCANEETISYEDESALLHHKTTLVRVYLGTAILPVAADICVACVGSFRSWFEAKQ